MLDPQKIRSRSMLLLSAFVAGSIATPAYAYIDPASGSMLLQLLLGGGAGLWLAIKGFFLSRRKK